MRNGSFFRKKKRKKEETDRWFDSRRRKAIHPGLADFHQVDWNISNSDMAAGTVPRETMSKITESVVEHSAKAITLFDTIIFVTPKITPKNREGIESRAYPLKRRQCERFIWLPAPLPFLFRRPSNLSRDTRQIKNSVSPRSFRQDRISSPQRGSFVSVQARVRRGRRETI